MRVDAKPRVTRSLEALAALSPLLTFAASVVACAASPPRDSVPESQERRGDQTSAPTYEHIARRPRATVALAEARGLDPTEAVAVVEGIADRLDGCARELGASGAGGGVVRVVARVADDGSVDGLNVKVEPGHGPIALRCVIAPLKLAVFKKTPGLPGAPRPAVPDGSVARGLAIEAQWAP